MAKNPQYEAVLFDLDGVLTSTAALHARCWKTVFDELLIEPDEPLTRPAAPAPADEELELAA